MTPTVRPRSRPLGWKDIVWRLWEEFNKDRILLIAAGASFYLLLALFPALAAFVSLYGFVADPVTVADHVAYLGGLLPPGGLEIIHQQLLALAHQDHSALGVGFFVGLAIALWSANSGIKALFDAMNIAYEETEKRELPAAQSLVHRVHDRRDPDRHRLAADRRRRARRAGVSLPRHMDGMAGRGGALAGADHGDHGGHLVSLPLRTEPRTGEMALAELGRGACHAGWIAASWLFSFYLQNFADYNATYGSLGAVVGLMMWTWISVIIVIVGAAVNAEMEHQTARDSTPARRCRWAARRLRCRHARQVVGIGLGSAGRGVRGLLGLLRANRRGRRLGGGGNRPTGSKSSGTERTKARA